MLRNTWFMDGSGLSRNFGFTMVSYKTDIEIIGMVKLIVNTAKVLCIFLEMTLHLAINLDYLCCLINPFNRSKNLVLIQTLTKFLQAYCVIMAFA